jgi:hypothetical protein
VPIASDNDAATISIAGMVTNRAHLLGLACPKDIHTVHVPLHCHTVHHVPLPAVLQLE